MPNSAHIGSLATQAAGGTERKTGAGITSLSGSSIDTGNLQGTTSFGGTILRSAGESDIYIAKLNADCTWDNDTEDAGQLSLDQGEIVDADQILLNFSKQLNDTEPVASRFKVLVNNKRNKVNSIETSGDEGQVILNMKKNIAEGDIVTLSYKDLAKDQNRNVIEDSCGNDLATVKNFPIESFVIDVEAPLIDDAEFSNNQITLYFNEELGAANVKNSRFKVTVDGKRNKVSSIEVAEEGTIVSITLRKKLKAGSDVLISYKDSKNDKKKGVIQDLAGNDVESFLGYRSVHIDNHSLGSEGKLRLEAEDVVFQYDPIDGNPGELLFAQSIASVETDNYGNILSFIGPQRSFNTSLLGYTLDLTGEIVVGQVGGAIDPITGEGNINVDEAKWLFWGDITTPQDNLYEITKNEAAFIPIRDADNTSGLLTLASIGKSAHGGGNTENIFSSYFVKGLQGSVTQDNFLNSLMIEGVNRLHPGFATEGTAIQWIINLQHPTLI